MAENTFGNRLGGRLNYTAPSQPASGFSTQIGQRLSQNNDRLVQALQEEFTAMQGTGDHQSQLNDAIQKMQQEMQGGGEEVSLAEAPWKGPLDPEGEVY